MVEPSSVLPNRLGRTIRSTENGMVEPSVLPKRLGRTIRSTENGMVDRSFCMARAGRINPEPWSSLRRREAGAAIAMITMGWARPEPNGNGRAGRCDCDDHDGVG